MQSKEDFWLGMDLRDVEEAGAFVQKEVWDSYIIKKKEGVTIKPNDFTKSRRK